MADESEQAAVALCGLRGSPRCCGWRYCGDCCTKTTKYVFRPAKSTVTIVCHPAIRRECTQLPGFG